MRNRTAFAALLIFLFSAALPAGAETITKQYGTDKIEFQTDQRKWKPVSEQGGLGQQVVEYVPEGQKEGDAAEFLRLNYMKGLNGEGAAKRFWEYTEYTLKNQCPGLDWKVLSKDPKSATYSWSAEGCPGVWPRRFEIGRVLEAPAGLFVIYYGSRETLPENRVKNWQAILEKALVA